MNTTNRDLLVLLNNEILSQKAIEHQVELLHEMLFKVESTENICIAHEILDLNRYKLITKASKVKDFIRKKELAPFIFLCNKN